MKKNIAFVLILVGLVSRIYSQQTEKLNTVKISPAVFLKGQIFEVHYERALFKYFNAAIGIAPIYMHEPTVYLSKDTIKYPLKGIAIDPEIRFYINSSGESQGFFIGLFNSSRFSRLSKSKDPILTFVDSWSYGDGYNSVDPTYQANDTYYLKEQLYIYGFQLGTKVIYNNGFVFDFYSGVGLGKVYYSSKNNRTNYTINSSGPRFHLRLNFALGYNF